MKVILVMVSSVNGKITHGGNSDVSSWSSKEDQEHFRAVVARAKLIVMGSGSFEAVGHKLQHTPGRLRVVMTRDVSKFISNKIPGQLEFSSESPEELVKKYQKDYDQMFVLGGGVINSLFLKAKLIDEIWLSLEPRVFGEGKDLFDSGDFEAKLNLESWEKVNEEGTLLLRYRVAK